MYPRVAIVLLCSFVAFGATAFVVPDCGPNGEFMKCGSACPKTCANPEPKMCTMQCIMGCFCKDGFLRNDKGECVHKEQCETQQLQAENFAMPQCPNNEIFHMCGSACAATCANPHPSPVCTRQCVIGCFCQPGYLRNKMHVCVPSANCEAQGSVEMFAYPPDHTKMPVEPKVCDGENEEFRQCKGCDGTCDKPHPICPKICRPGCACKHGHVRDVTGKCMKLEQCKMDSQMNFALPPSICSGENEESVPCKKCDRTCDNPERICPRIPRCRPGCACKLGHVRDATNKCVKKEQCKMEMNMMVMPPVCKETEVFKTCGTACPATCDNPHPSAICTRNCVIGCFCKEGYLRHANGECVAAANCEMQEMKAETVTHPYGDDILCPTEREVYIDDDLAAQFNCMQSCDTPLPWMKQHKVVIPPKCQQVKAAPGCVCRFPYYRNEENKCVERKECHPTTTPMMTTPAH